jgi:flavin reductase (DIM6/NTAB) family NADH-FMN oxidoreductase RutF
MLIDLTSMPPAQAYFIMTQSVIPRPIAWVLSENDAGDYNLAPFSYFNAVASDPPIIIFSVGPQDDGGAKDTTINIEKRPEFTVNIASVGQLPVLNETSATLPYGTSEVTANDLALESVEGFAMPRVRDSKIAFQCERYHVQRVGNRDQMLVFGEIKSIYVADDCVEINEKGRIKIHADRIEPLSRLGAGEYATFGEIMQAKRPA